MELEAVGHLPTLRHQEHTTTPQSLFSDNNMSKIPRRHLHAFKCMRIDTHAHIKDTLVISIHSWRFEIKP